MTAAWVLLTGMAMLVVGAIVALTLLVYGGRAFARVRARRGRLASVWLPSARVVNR
ncbi:MAG: hypothetical protein ACKV2T_11540 [Kofleriaceae bacterium]